jgi:hypothetical protein
MRAYVCTRVRESVLTYGRDDKDDEEGVRPGGRERGRESLRIIRRIPLRE